MERRPATLLALAAVLWGTTGTAQALGGAEGSPLTVGAARLLIGSLGLVALAGGSFTRPPVLWLALGAVAMAAYQVAFFAAVARAGVALGTVVAIGVAPVVAGVLGRLVRGEPPGARWWSSTIFAVVGVLLIGGRPQEVDVGGVALAVLAGVAYATSALASKFLVEVMAPTAAMAAMFGGAALLLAPLLPFADLSWLTRPPGMAAALWLGLGATTLAYAAFAAGLRGATVGQAATMGLAEPATATVLGVTALGERPSVAAWIGVALVVAALGILSRPPAAEVVIP